MNFWAKLLNGVFIPLRNATEITPPSGLPDRPFSALRQQLHSLSYAPVVAP